MSGIDNLFQEETLLSNIKIAAYFILLYEHFEDVVISTVKEFYAHDCVLNGQLFLSIDDAYIQCLEKRIENGEKPCTHLKHSLVSAKRETSVYKGYKQDKIEMRGDRAEMSDFPLYLNTVAGGLDRRDQTIGGFSFVVKIYAVPVVEIIGQLLYLLGRYGFNAQFSDCL